MDIIVGTAGIFVIGVLLYALFFGAASGASKKPTYTSRRIFPPGLAESYTEYDYRMFDLDDGATKFEYEFDERHNDVIDKVDNELTFPSKTPTNSHAFNVRVGLAI